LRSKSAIPSLEQKNEIYESSENIDYINEDSQSSQSETSPHETKIKNENPLLDINFSQSIASLQFPQDNSIEPEKIQENLYPLHLFDNTKKNEPSNKHFRKSLVRRNSQSTCTELVRTFNKTQSEEEKEALNAKLNVMELSDFKSQFYKFANNLKIPQRKRESTLSILEKKEFPRSSKEIKFFPENFTKKNQVYNNAKINLDFKGKNKLYCSKIGGFAIKNIEKATIDRTYLRKKKSLFITRFEENTTKFFEKLVKFYNYHQNPFFFEDDHQMNLANSKMISSKLSFYRENGMINLSEIFSNKLQSDLNLMNNNNAALDEEALNSSNSLDDDDKDSVYNFTSKKSNEKYTIKVNSPDVNINPGEEFVIASLSNIGTPSEQNKKNFKIEKIEKSGKSNSCRKRMSETEELQKKKFLSTIKRTFEDLDRKSMKVFDVYSYKKIWKLFKLLIFTNLQIFLSGNFYEILTLHSKDILAIEGELKQNKTSPNKPNLPGVVVSYLFSCPFYVFLEKGQECYAYKNVNGQELIFFEYKFEKITAEKEKTDEKEENDMRKNIQKSSDLEEEGDSPLMVWDPISRLSLIMEDDYFMNSNKLNDSEISLEKDDELYENEKYHMKLTNGLKIEQFFISYKSLGILIKHLHESILPFMTNIDIISKHSVQQKLPLVPYLNIQSNLNEEGREFVKF